MGKVFDSDNDSKNILGADATRAQRVLGGQATRAKNVKIAAHTKGGVNKGRANYHKISEGLAKPKGVTPGYAANHKKKEKEYTKNPIRKSFWSQSLPHYGKSYTDWAADAGVEGMYAARDGMNDLGPSVKDYGKHMASTLDFGLDLNEGDYIVGLEDYKKDDEDQGLRVLGNLGKILGAGVMPGAAGGTGSAIAKGLAGRTAAKTAAARAVANDAAGPPLEHPALAEATDKEAMDRLIDDLGFFPDDPEPAKATVSSIASGLAKPKPKPKPSPVVKKPAAPSPEPVVPLNTQSPLPLAFDLAPSKGRSVPVNAPPAKPVTYSGPAEPLRVVGGVQTYSYNPAAKTGMATPSGKSIFEQYDEVQRRLTPNRGVDMNRHLERMLASGMPEEQAFSEALKIGMRGLQDQADAGLLH